MSSHMLIRHLTGGCDDFNFIHSSSEDESYPFLEDTFPSESLSDPPVLIPFACLRYDPFVLIIFFVTEILLPIFKVKG